MDEDTVPQAAAQSIITASNLLNDEQQCHKAAAHFTSAFRLAPQLASAFAEEFAEAAGAPKPPKLTVSVATMTWTEDMTAALSADRRFTVDTGADVIVLRAPSVSEKNTWIRAFEREQALLSPRASANVGLARTQRRFFRDQLACMQRLSKG